VAYFVLICFKTKKEIVGAGNYGDKFSEFDTTQRVFYGWW
jgi:hypothetical protein